MDNWLLKVPTISINPESASRDDIARLATELMELRGGINKHEREVTSHYQFSDTWDRELWDKVK